ncbi:MAG TPA: MFS transporter [Acidimicrobiales bacterium]
MQRPPGRDPFAAYLLGFLTVGLAVSFLGPGLLYLQGHAGVSVQAISILFSAQALGYLFGSLLAAPGIDRQGGNRLLAASLVGLGIVVALVPLLSSLWTLAIVFCLIGTGAGSIDLASNTLLVWSRGDGVGPSMNALHFAFGVGAVTAPLLVELSLSTTDSLTVACLVTGAVALVAAAWVFTRHSPTVASHPDHAPGADAAAGRQTTTRRLAVIAGFFVLYVGLEMGAGGWLFAYAQARNLGGPRFAALLTTAFWGAFTFGRLVAVGLSHRFRPAQLLVGSSSLAIVAALALALTGTGAAATMASAVGLGLALAPQYPTMMTIAGQHLHLTGRATSWFIGASAAGGLVLPWFIGQLFGGVGAATMPVVVLITAAATLGWILVILRMLHAAPLITPDSEPPIGSAML